MWVSRRTDYATRALLALTLEDGGPLKLEELARRTAVPQSVLEQVMPTMRTAGIVRSERGPAGGYRLNKKPDEITLERIVRVFQGPLAPITARPGTTPSRVRWRSGARSAECGRRCATRRSRSSEVSRSRTSQHGPGDRGSTRRSSLLPSRS